MLELSRLAAAAALLSTVLYGAGCGNDLPDEAPPLLGAPITDLPQNQWSWVDFPDSTCDDGSPTGLAISPGVGPNLLIFLNGGGACWDYTTCFIFNTAAQGPFGRDQFLALRGEINGTIVDRSITNNPFRDWSFVFAPYCTGDVHAGDNVAEYPWTDGPVPYRHEGRTNLVAFLKRIAPTFPSAPKVVFAGSSAGGFGASLNYALARSYFRTGQMYLLDDAGPVLIGDEVPPSFVDAWYTNWRLDKALDPLCPGCRRDLSQLVPALKRRYPNDRAALLSSVQDEVIRAFFVKSGDQFQADLYDLADRVLDPISSLHYFFVPGSTHTLLRRPASFTATDGTRLLDWLNQMISDDPAWSSHKP